MQWIFWLIAVFLSAGAGYLVYRRDKQRAVPYPWLTSLLRSLVVFFTLLLILVPTITVTKNIVEKPIIVLLQDNSRSIGNALGSDSVAYRKNIQTLTDRLSANYKVITRGFGSKTQTDSIFRYWQPATDISMALSGAQEYFGLQNLGAVILATDGRFNQGENPLYQQLVLHSSLYTVAIGDSTQQKDLSISKVYANKIVLVNSSFEIRADIVATLCKGYSNSISVKEDGNLLVSLPLSINADRWDHSVSFTIKAAKAGLHHYMITIPQADGEKNIANNRKDVFVEVVDEKKNILIASAAPHPDVNAIKEALNGLESYKVTVCGSDNFPSSLAGYDVIILHGLPSKRNNVLPKVIAAKKPVWFIISSQSDITAINAAQNLTHTVLTAAPLHDAIAAYNPSFNTFTVPQQIQSVTDKMPPLQISAGKIVSAPGANILFSQKTTGGSAATPLWILQQGSVSMAILMGEGIWRWRLYEYKNYNDHTIIDECIQQTVAFLSANNNEKTFSVNLPKYIWSDEDNIAMNAYLLNTNNEQVNTPDVQLIISDSAGRKQNFSFERSGTAYSLNIGIWAGGAYSYAARTTYNGKEYTATGKFVVESTQPEMMQSGADYPLLYSLAKKYNGAFVPAANVAALYDSIARNEHIKPLIQTNTEVVPLVDRKWYFFIILLLATGEWLLRKYWLAQ